MSKTRFPEYEILLLRRDQNGPCIKLRAAVGGTTAVLRVAVDEESFDALCQVCRIRTVDSISGTRDIYFLGGSNIGPHNENIQNEFAASVKRCWGKESEWLQIICSKQYALNVNWLLHEVTKMEQVDYLRWENFLT